MNTSVDSIKEILLRDLSDMEKELKLYSSEADLWTLAGEIKNPTGNLILHICGNLQHFIGAVIGKNGYVRKRDQEFNNRNVPIAELFSEIKKTKVAVENTLDQLTDEQLRENYPIEVFGKPMTFSYFLTHLTGHLMYHLGQINYHRRLLSP